MFEFKLQAAKTVFQDVGNSALPLSILTNVLANLYPDDSTKPLRQQWRKISTSTMSTSDNDYISDMFGKISTPMMTNVFSKVCPTVVNIFVKFLPISKVFLRASQSFNSL